MAIQIIKCCCCIPLRAGVIIISILWIIYGVSSVVLHINPVASGTRVLRNIPYVLITIGAAFGLIAVTCSNTYRMLRIYSKIAYAIAAFDILNSIISITITSISYVRICRLLASCSPIKFIIINIVVAIITFLFSVYFSMVIANYEQRRKEEEDAAQINSYLPQTSYVGQINGGLPPTSYGQVNGGLPPTLYGQFNGGPSYGQINGGPLPTSYGQFNGGLPPTLYGQFNGGQHPTSYGQINSNLSGTLHGQVNGGSPLTSFNQTNVDLRDRKNNGQTSGDLHGRENDGQTSGDLHGRENDGRDLHGRENDGQTNGDFHGRENDGIDFHGQAGDDLQRR